MEAEKNMAKYETYKTLLQKLNTAMKSAFYYEALFLEYALFEDRLASLLKHAGVPYVYQSGRQAGEEIRIQQKINKVRDRPEFHSGYVRGRITVDLLRQIEDWKDTRNHLVHRLAARPYSDAAVKEAADTGYALLKLFKDRVRTVNRYHDKARNSAGKGESS